MTVKQKLRSELEKAFFVFISIIIFSACFEDKPTKLKEENNSLVTATIGIDGGELKTDDFSLTVPAGSFQREINLSLSISAESASFGESADRQTSTHIEYSCESRALFNVDLTKTSR